MVDARTLLESLQQAGFPIIGLSLGDVGDPATWRFDGPLTADQRAQAVAVVQTALLLDRQGPIPVTPAGPTLDQVIAWQAAKLGLSADQAHDEIAQQPASYVRKG